MCVGEVVDHILTVLKNPRMVVWLCGDYSWILLQHVLQKPHYILPISSTVWNGQSGLVCTHLQRVLVGFV